MTLFANATLPQATDRHGHALPRTTIISGERLRQARREHGLSRETLAYSSGLAITTIARLERQPRSPVRLRTLYRIAKALGEPPADLTQHP
jgi:transcriptional regulator with XRE-family HTH domain